MESSVEVKDIILCIDNLTSRPFSPESDTRSKVWLKANRMRLEKTVQSQENSRLETIQLTTVVAMMVCVALLVVAVRILVTGAPPLTAHTGPPYDDPFSTQYQYVVDWSVEFPEAKAAERRIPVLKSSVYSF